MAILLLAVVIALMVGHVLPDLARLRRWDALATWSATSERAGAALGIAQGGLGAAITLGVPVALVGLLQYALADVAFGLAPLALGAVVLFLCWGPRDLDLDIEAVAGAPDGAARLAALQALPAEPPEPPLTWSGTVLVDEVFRAALRRWFGVLFWFIVLGPMGAVLYRAAQLLGTQRRFAPALPAGQREAIAGLTRVLDWPAAQLMTLALAIAADFDTVASAWRDFHAARGKALTLDTGFLTAAGRASVDADEADAGDSYADPGKHALGDLAHAHALIWRILWVWLTVFALLVLAGSIR